MITSVGTTAATDASTGAAAMKQATGMNKDDFLKLFVTQLKNQDPLNPQDSSQFIGQLAQLTQVEQAYNANTNLQQLMNLQGSGIQLSSASFIGKSVLAKGDQIPVTGGAQTPLNFSLDSAASSVTLNILNASGNVVKTMTLGATAAGANQVTWDGKDTKGLPVTSGTYQLKVSAADASGNKITGTPLQQGMVSGVKLDGTDPVLTVNGVDISLTNVIRVNGA